MVDMLFFTHGANLTTVRTSPRRHDLIAGVTGEPYTLHVIYCILVLLAGLEDDGIIRRPAAAASKAAA